MKRIDILFFLINSYFFSKYEIRTSEKLVKYIPKRMKDISNEKT